MRWIQLFQGLLTPTIASPALYIAHQQWQTNKLKCGLDRYDRRLRVYQHLLGFIGWVLRDFKVEPSDVVKSRVDTSEAEFLFGPEIPAYLDRLGA